MDIKDYSLSKIQTKQEIQKSIAKKHLDGLIRQGRNVSRALLPLESFEKGITLQSAEKSDAVKTKLLILAELARLVRAVNATRSFQSDEDQMDAVDDILEIFPSLKLEEVILCFKMIRQGKYELFGNLTTNILIKCLKRYELENTIPLREQQQTKFVNFYETANIDWQRATKGIEWEIPKKSLEELGGHLHLTAEDLKEIDKGKKAK